MDDASLSERELLITSFMREPWLAHACLFRHRHPSPTPVFHAEIVRLWHDRTLPRVLIQAFRGAAKSTLAEEAIVIASLLRSWRNIIILGETYERAVERLRAIRHEIETNPYINELFGDQIGPTWTEARIILNNGTIVQAFGRGQSLRGSKHLDSRPDCAFCDDIENEESTSSLEQIEKTKQWFLAVVLPALEPTHVVRINGTPLHPRSLICQLAQDPAWATRTYPIEYIDNISNQRSSTWPARFPLARIDELRRDYARLGMAHSFAQEYMCQAEDPAHKIFTPAMFHVDPSLVHTWQPCYAMVDPARTTNRNSAMTGVAVWSWIGNRLIVWDAYGGFWKPDEIVNNIFAIDDRYSPVAIGVERDGLEEFILQPLRHEQLRRGRSIPVRPMKAPQGKQAFITGLQPYLVANEAVFAKPCPEAFSQFLNFPSGLIDIPNALAYAPVMRPGNPVYDFSSSHVAELVPDPHRPFWLALNSDGRCTAAALLQLIEGQLRILADGVSEGDPASRLASLACELALDAATSKLRYVIPPSHYTAYNTTGLIAAVRHIPAAPVRGGDPPAGRTGIARLLTSLSRGAPAFLVSPAARWSLNAFSGGYAREVNPRSGQLGVETVQNPYRMLAEGIESFVALTATTHLQEDDLPINYQVTADGRRYISSRAVNERR